MNRGNCLRNIIYITAVAVIALVIYSFVNPSANKIQTVAISQIAQDVNDGKVQEITVNQDQIRAK